MFGPCYTWIPHLAPISRLCQTNVSAIQELVDCRSVTPWNGHFFGNLFENHGIGRGVVHPRPTHD
jgi:hypothetical protein